MLGTGCSFNGQVLSPDQEIFSCYGILTFVTVIKKPLNPTESGQFKWYPLLHLRDPHFAHAKCSFLETLCDSKQGFIPESQFHGQFLQ
jgi:hypothetical protein